MRRPGAWCLDHLRQGVSRGGGEGRRAVTLADVLGPVPGRWWLTAGLSRASVSRGCASAGSSHRQAQAARLLVRYRGWPDPDPGMLVPGAGWPARDGTESARRGPWRARVRRPRPASGEGVETSVRGTDGVLDLIPPRAGAGACVHYRLTIGSVVAGWRGCRKEKSVLVTPGGHFRSATLRVGADPSIRKVQKRFAEVEQLITKGTVRRVPGARPTGVAWSTSWRHLRAPASTAACSFPSCGRRANPTVEFAATA